MSSDIESHNMSGILLTLWEDCEKIVSGDEYPYFPLNQTKWCMAFLGKSALGGQRKAQPWSAYLGCPCSYPPGRTYSFVRSKAIHARTAHPYFIKQNPLRGLTLGKLRLTYYLGGWKSDCRFHKCTCLGRFLYYIHTGRCRYNLYLVESRPSRHLLLVATKQRPVLHGGTERLLALAEQGQSAHRRRLVNLSKLELNRQCVLWIRKHIFAAR